MTHIHNSWRLDVYPRWLSINSISSIPNNSVLQILKMACEQKHGFLGAGISTLHMHVLKVMYLTFIYLCKRQAHISYAVWKLATWESAIHLQAVSRIQGQDYSVPKDYIDVDPI